MRWVLESYANCIEQVLARHGILARVTGGTVAPRRICFQAVLHWGRRASITPDLLKQLATALGAPSVQIDCQGSVITVRVPREDPCPVQLQPLLRGLHNVPPVTAVLGIADDGVPLLIHLPSPDVAHLLVAGTTGSGKTTLLRAIILSLAYFNRPPTTDRQQALVGSAPSVAFVLIDPKGNAFRDLEGLPHLARPVISDPAEAAEALKSLVKLMKIRSKQGAKKESVAWPICVLVIDELVDLVVAEPEIESPLMQLLTQGQEAGIHVVAATQRPSAAVIGSLVKANFRARLCGKVTSPEDARIATGLEKTGAEHLLSRGDFIAAAEGQLHHFQAAYVGPKETRTIAMKIQRQESL